MYEGAGQGQARVLQEVTNSVVIKNQSPYSLTDLEPPPCELSKDVGINSLGRPLQEIRVFPHVFSYSERNFRNPAYGYRQSGNFDVVYPRSVLPSFCFEQLLGVVGC